MIKEYQEGRGLFTLGKRLSRLLRICGTQAGFDSESKHFSDHASKGKSERGSSMCEVVTAEMGTLHFVMMRWPGHWHTGVWGDDRQLRKTESKVRLRN